MDEQERDEETAQRLKTAEIAALALLLLRLKAALKKAKRQPLFTAAGTIAAELSSGIYLARRAARAAGLERLVIEAAELRVSLPSTLGPLTAASDLVRAEAVARSYARQWAQAAEEARNAGLDPFTATDELKYALVRTAATENATAFNAERELAIAGIVDDGLRKRWDARLDACPLCADANGTLVLPHEEFPQGRPAEVHPNCRCFETLVRIH